MSFRDVKRRARLDLHNRLADPVLYVTDAGKPSELITAVTARLHLSYGEVGELLRGGYAEMPEALPTAVFLSSQGTPSRGAIVVTKDMGAWRVETALPPNDITIAAELVKMTDSQVTQLGWLPNVQFMGLGDPTPISPVGPPSLPLPQFNWEVDEW